MHNLCFAAADGLEFIEMLDLIKDAGFEGYFTHPYIACEIDKILSVFIARPRIRSWQAA